MKAIYINRLLFLFYYFFIFLFISCTSTQDDTCEMVVYDHTDIKEQFPLSSYIDRVESVRLELPEPYFFGEVATVLFDKSGIYILDSKQDKVFRFDENGTFLNTIGKCGEGPGEYANMSSCFLGKNSVYIDDDSSRKIYEYSFNGDYIATVSYPFDILYNYAMELPDKNFLCHSADGFWTTTHGVWILDRQGNMRRVLAIPEKTPYCLASWKTMTLREDGKYQIYDPPVGAFYLFDPVDESIKKFFQHRSSYKMSGDFVGMTDIKNEDVAMGNWIVNGERFLFSVWGLPNTDKLYYTIYDKKTKKSETYKSPKIDIPGLLFFNNWKFSNLPNAWVHVTDDQLMNHFYPDKLKELQMNERVLIVEKLFLKR